jgi:hypothetical protein
MSYFGTIPAHILSPTEYISDPPAGFLKPFHAGVERMDLISTVLALYISSIFVKSQAAKSIQEEIDLMERSLEDG